MGNESAILSRTGMLKMNNTRYFLILIGIALAIGMLLFAFTREKTPGKIFFDAPHSTTVNQQFEVKLYIGSSVAVNAAELYFTFPKELVKVESINKDGSIFALWIKNQPTFNNSAGEISFAGGLPTPGFKARKGLVATVKFIGISRGEGKLLLDSKKSRMLANDGLGTEVEAVFEPISFTIK